MGARRGRLELTASRFGADSVLRRSKPIRTPVLFSTIESVLARFRESKPKAVAEPNEVLQ